jgi:hypothetical protein
MQKHQEVCVNRFHRLPSLVAASLLLAAGCSSGPKPTEPSTIARLPEERTLNADIVEMSLSQQVRDGAAEGRTIYPHHFVNGGAELNLIGERQVEALLPQSASDKTEINVLRGDASDDLYRARVETLRKRFLDAGFDQDRIAFVDKLPSGDGISSERVLQIAAQEQQQRQGRGGGGTSSRDREFDSGFRPESGSMGGTGGTSGGGSRGGGSSGGGGGYSR